MPLVLKNRVQVTSTSTGTGAFTLGSAVTGYQNFAGVGDGNQTYYLITDGVNWETGIGTYTSSGTTLSRDRVFASSNSGALVNWGAGTKTVLSGFPALGTPGGIPACDDNEIGTDLTGWQAFRAAVESGITGGVTYDNGGVGGIVSTYSLVYTTSAAYSGGVLTPNGDIHFIPRGAVGQKISAAGVVSTYSLVYTTTAAYEGGVLSPNGDIHFIPFGANRGQKISAAGVVSTYSLVYTTSTGAYGGGVLAPNGDIHFVPRSANRGQKISAAGVVSTYSLVYTTTSAYEGGVLAQIGRAHV
jgi:hypothetical protein